MYIGQSVEESGYPLRVNCWGVISPATEWNHTAPSAAALALLQARARARIMICAAAMVGAQHVKADVVFRAEVYDPQRAWHVGYMMVVKLDDNKLPAHAAHFRAAAKNGALGHMVHRCFALSQNTPAALPYVTLYHPSNDVPCAELPCTLPLGDLVYSENSPPPAGMTYPAGTVLMHPRSVIPSVMTHAGRGTYDTPVFLVFQPCAASLLPGAVPVGRVISCVKGKNVAERSDITNIEASPFDATVTACFEAHSKSVSCSKEFSSTSSSIYFSSFLPT